MLVAVNGQNGHANGTADHAGTSTTDAAANEDSDDEKDEENGGAVESGAAGGRILFSFRSIRAAS